MIIKARELVSDNGKEALEVEDLEDNKVLIKYRDLKYDALPTIEKTIDLNTIFSPYYTCSIFMNLDKTEITDPIKVPISRGGKDLFLETNDLGKRLCIIAFSDTIDKCAFILTIPSYVSCEIYSNAKPFSVISDIFPEFEPHFQVKQSREKLLTALDCNNSLAGLEAQVDYLTMVVKYLVNSTDTQGKIYKEFPDLKRFFDIYDNYNVLTIKPKEDTFKSVEEHKKHIRENQEEFYKEIQGVEINGI